MRTANMPGGQGKDAELFAAAVEQGAPPGHADDAELTRDLEIVAMLRSRGEAFAPRPDEKARAKQRLMALLAEQPDGPARRDDARPAPEPTAALGHLPQPTSCIEAPDLAATARLPAVGDAPLDGGSAHAGSAHAGDGPTGGADSDADSDTGGDTGGGRQGRRSGRHNLPSGMSSRPVPRPRGSRRPPSRTLRRRTLVGAAALVAMVVTAGMGVLASRDALPGDNLYALKRVAESTGVALAFDEESKARRHLEVATTRMDEVEQMIRRSPSEPVDAELATSALQEFDAATGEGSRILLTSDHLAGTRAVQDLRVWAADQSDRLTALRHALPVPAASTAEDALDLLERLMGRTRAPAEREPCSEPTGSAADDPGPLRTAGACAPRAVAPADPGPGDQGDPDAGADPGKAPPADAAPLPTTAPADPGGDAPGEITGRSDGGPAPGAVPEVPAERRAPDAGSSGAEKPKAPAPTRAPRSSEREEPPALLPPVEVPPLVPGLPGLTVG